MLAEAACSVESAGADFIILCTNTMHKVAAQIEAAIDIPLVHIADCTGKALANDGITSVGLLGTRFTMQQDFYKQRISDDFGIHVITPDANQQETIHNIIYNELVMGEVKDASRNLYLDIMADLKENGAQAIILGCTEIALLIQQQHTDIPLFDTTQIHVDHALEVALASSDTNAE